MQIGLAKAAIQPRAHSGGPSPVAWRKKIVDLARQLIWICEEKVGGRRNEKMLGQNRATRRTNLIVFMCCRLSDEMRMPHKTEIAIPFP